MEMCHMDCMQGYEEQLAEIEMDYLLYQQTVILL
jgi:hypothetical protein